MCRGRFIIGNGRTNGPRSRPAMISSPLATFAQPLDPSAEKRLAEVQEQLQKLEHRECSTNQVEAFLARLRHIEAECGGQKIPIRFSAGWVGYELGETTEQFLDRADRTLYAEKRARKARIKELVPVA